MKKTNWMMLILCVFLLVILASCGGGSGSSNSTPTENSQTDDGTNSSDQSNTADSESSVHADHDDPSDYTWDASDVIPIELNGSTISVTSDNATVDGGIVTITTAGVYSLSGFLTDGQVIVDTTDDETVTLILNGIDIENSTSAPLFIRSAAKVVLFLPESVENFISDAENYVFEDAEAEEPNAALFSKSDLTIFGDGALTISGNFNDGLAGKDGVIIAGGAITVDAADDGIRGKDYLVVKDGTLTVNALGDGVKSDNDEDSTKGFISIKGGQMNITAQGDAIQAVTDILVTDGSFNLTTGGGSGSTIDLSNLSAKGLKAAAAISIDGGSFTIDCADDALHSNQSITINGGIFDIASADDGIHADTSLDINQGDIRITQSYEGMESAIITIDDGDISIIADDDGINVAGGNDGSAMGRPGEGDFNGSSGQYLQINGGYIVINSDGDGLDSNGTMEMTGGDVIVHGPTNNNNGALDYQSFTMSGGFIVAAGSSGMAQIPGSNTSSQNALLLNFNSSQSAGILVHIETTQGDDLLTFAPSKPYQSIAFSSPELTTGTTCEVYTGGSSSAQAYDGLYLEGAYTPGTRYTTFTLSGVTTYVGSSGGIPGP